MSPLPALAPVSPALLQGAPAADAAELAKRTRIKDAANQFESQFLSSMFQQMFEGVSSEAPFGGGFGEDMFRSVLTEAMAKQVTKAGGIGVAATVQREMLKLQGLK